MVNKQINRCIATIALGLSLAMVIACGGGGGSSENPPSNAAPVARAGDARVVTEGSEVTLDGTASTDPDGTIVSFRWEQTPNGAPAVSLTDADSPSPSFTAPAPATRKELLFMLTVADNQGATDSDTVSVTINLKPVVDAGADRTVPFSGAAPITVTLSASYHDDGTIESHHWVQVDGDDWALVTVDNTIAGISRATFATTGEPTAAAATFSYTATDDVGAQGSDTVTVYLTRTFFADAFDDGGGWTARWSPINAAPTTDWQVYLGELLQKNDIQAFEGSTSYHLGTYALLSNPPDDIPQDYRFSVDIFPSTNFTGSRHQGNDVGIMFRYQDADNYYRVSMSARYGFTRFEKRTTDGGFETLAVNAIGYVDNQPMTMAAEVNGGTIIVWIDGDPVFALVDDDPIPRGTVALYCQDRAQFDNVLITEPPLQPTVVIAAPLAWSVALTGDEDTLDVQAVTLNAPAGASVEFTRYSEDGNEKKTAAANIGYYTARFFDVPPGEHDIMAVLKDAEGNEIGHDINSTVGTGGGYYVAVGDSITNGTGDNDSTNNETLDGRIVARQGFQAPLADLLTDATGRPAIVFNEGIGGDRASDLLLRIDSILERHPSANGYLLMIGTNDSLSVPASSFKTSVTNTAAKIDTINGKAVWLAEVMPRYPDDGSWTVENENNTQIRAYNTSLRQIAASNPNDATRLGPNFFQGLFVENPTAVYTDNIHPNDDGYQLMAEKWLETLTP